MDEKSNIYVTKVTSENQSALLRIAGSQYIGLSCRCCGKKYETYEDVVVAEIWDGEQPMHKECFAQIKALTPIERSERGFNW